MTVSCLHFLMVYLKSPQLFFNSIAIKLHKVEKNMPSQTCTR